MDVGTTELSLAIGARVKQERQSRRWTLDKLAEAAAVSRRMIINVEQGAANPSVGILLRISEALGIGLPALVEPPQQHAFRVTRSGEAPTLWRGEFGGTGVMVTSSTAPNVVVLWDWTLEPGDRHTSDEHLPGTKELLQVLQGTIVLTAGGQAHVLEAGDGLSFSGDVQHSYANQTATTARFALAVFEPGAGALAGLDADGD